MSFNFKLQVGSVVKLKETIPGIHKCDDWKTGLYRVERIHAPFCYGADKLKPQCQSYVFKKVKKDGTVYKSFNNGYRCMAWDNKIDEGKVEIVSV
jgi:hypothetical protein